MTGLNILFLVSSEGYYGIENMLVALARNLSLLGCRCIVGVFRDSRLPHTEVAEVAEQQGLTVEIVQCDGRLDRSAVKQIRRLLTKYEVDVVHPHGYKADLYAYAASLQHRVALVATSHNWPSKRLDMRAYAALDRLVLCRFDGVVAVSDPVHATLRRWGVRSDKLITIPNAVDVEHFQNAAPTLRKEIAVADGALVGFVGRLVRDKGGALLLRAAQQVLAIRPNTQFVLVGEGPSRSEWQELAVELGIAQNVVFTGTRSDMPGIYASLDILALPSLVESMPMCMLEAMAASKPVIATNVGAIPRLIVPDRTGLLLKPGDIAGLARAIIQLVDNPIFARELGENACSEVRQNYSAQGMAKAYLRHYQGIMATRSAGIRARVEAHELLSPPPPPQH